MLGYNVFVMDLRAIGIFLLALNKYVKKYHIRRSTSQWGGGVTKSAPPVHFFLGFFFNPSLRNYGCFHEGCQLPGGSLGLGSNLFNSGLVMGHLGFFLKT